MKKIFIILALFATGFLQNNFAQDGSKTQSSQLLLTYYQLKDNLIKSNPHAVAASAAKLEEDIKSSTNEDIYGDYRDILLKDAEAISHSKDISLQREKFAILSNNMFALAKKTRLTSEPVYQQYCPMKKTSWLSNDKAIKNPYYGSAMLTCGYVKTTL